MGVNNLTLSVSPPHQYKLEKRDLQGRTLNLSVWHHDSLGRNVFLGEVEIALGAWDWANTRPEWFSLQPRVSSQLPPRPTPPLPSTAAHNPPILPRCPSPRMASPAGATSTWH